MREDLMGKTQKGTLAEVAIANAIELLTEGRLKCARPQPDDHGTDYIVYQPGSGVSVDIQVKAAYATGANGALQYRLECADVPRDPRRYFVLCLQGTASLPGFADEMLLIPGSVFAARRSARGAWHFSVGTKRKGRSTWAAWRVARTDLGPRLVELLEAAAAAQARRLPPVQWAGISPQLMGKITEDAVAHVLITQSEGRLAVFRPYADTVGLDGVVMSLESRVSAPMQIKGSFVEAQDERVQINVYANTFRARPERMVVVAPYLQAELRLCDRSWVVPADRFAKLARRKGDQLYFRASPKSDSNDRWTPYRVATADLARVFEGAIAARART